MPFIEWSPNNGFVWKFKHWKFLVFATDALEADRNANKGIQHPLNYFRRNLDNWTNACGSDAFSVVTDDSNAVCRFQWK